MYEAKAESFFTTLKREKVYLKEYQIFSEAAANISLVIEDVYNQKRLHSSSGYIPLAEFEALHYRTAGMCRNSLSGATGSLHPAPSPIFTWNPRQSDDLGTERGKVIVLQTTAYQPRWQ